MSYHIPLPIRNNPAIYPIYFSRRTLSEARRSTQNVFVSRNESEEQESKKRAIQGKAARERNNGKEKKAMQCKSKQATHAESRPLF